MICPKCNTANPEAAKFCMSCGSPLGLACANCGAELPSEAQFCFACGQKIGGPVDVPQPADVARFEQYIPAELLAKLDSARTRGGMQGERRVVTMLFCDVKGSTAAAERLDPEEWADIMNGAFEHLISPVYAYEGTLARLMGDAILAFFGAPIAHEDDPQRAVLAGLEILEAVGPYKREIERRWGFDFDVRVGINTGLVVVGEVGSDLRVEYTALGDAVNLAARMEQTADPGTVRISSQTHKLIAPMFEFEDLGDIEVKGKSDPVKAYRVFATKAEPGQLRGIQGLRSPLIGRAKEIEQLREAVSDLRRGRGQIISLMGDAGLGKSRLAAEMRDEALAVSGIDWHEARSVSYQTHKPYAPFTHLINTVLEVPAGVTDSERYHAVASHLSDLLPNGSEDAAPLIGSMLGIDLPPESQEAVKYLEPPELRERIFGAVKQVVAALAAKMPTVLVFEDLHWADPTSADLVEELLPLTDSTPLMLVAAFRPQRQDPSWRFHETANRDFHHRYTPIELKPLDADETRSMCTNLLQVDSLPDHVRSLVLRKTEGNPFFVEEVLRSLLDSGAITQDGNHLRTNTAVEDIAVPETLTGMLTTRLDQLDDASKHAAQTASVIGREFNVDLLRMIEDTGADLDSALNALQRRGLVRETSRFPRGVFMFKHALTQEAAYESLLLSTRRKLHGQVAAWLQEEEPERVDDIGRHLLEAREYARALPYLVMAGDGAARRFSMREAIASYRRAVGIVDAVGDLALARQAFEGLGMALHFNSQIPEALAAYEQMEKFAQEHSDHPMLVSSLNKQAFIAALRVGDTPLAEQKLIRAEAVATAEGDEPGLAELNMTYCQIRTTEGDLEDAYDRLQVAAKIGRKLDMIEPKLFGMVHVANTLNYMTRFQEAKQAADEAMAVATEAGHLGWEAELLSLTYPFGMMSTGDIQGGLETAEKGTNLAAQIGSANREAFGALLQGLLSRLVGDYERAITMDERAARISADIGVPYVEAAALGELGSAYLDVSPRHSDKANELHARALACLDRPLGSALGALVWADVGFGAMAQGNLDQAALMFTKGLEFPTATKLFARPQLHLGLGFVSMMRGEVDQAFEKMDSARSYAAERGMAFFAPVADMALGMFFGSANQPDKALDHFTDAETRADAMGMWPTLWQTRASAAGLLRTLGRTDEADEKRRLAGETIDAIAERISDAGLRNDFMSSATAKL